MSRISRANTSLEGICVRTQSVHVPVPLLLDHEIFSGAKLTWMLMRLLQAQSGSPPSKLRLHHCSGLARTTIRRAIHHLSDAGWCTRDGLAVTQGQQAATVRAFSPLLTDRRVSAVARVLHPALRQFGYPTGQVSLGQLSTYIGMDYRTLKKAIAELVESGWLDLNDTSRRRPVSYTYRNPVALRFEATIDSVKKRLRAAPFIGEALMREYLTATIQSDEYEDDASPGFLVNPYTGERLQLDRYYPPHVAFEYNGPQHYGPTQLFSAEDSVQQQGRDMVKSGLCKNRGVDLVTVHAHDLSSVGIQTLVGSRLPLRNLAEQEPVLAFLDSIARRYRAKAADSVLQMHG